MKVPHRISTAVVLLVSTLLFNSSWAAPMIQISPASFMVTIPPDATQTNTMTITNIGDAALDWDVIEHIGDCLVLPPTDITWLSVNPTSGTTPPGGSSPVGVTFDSTGLAPGDYTGNLCVDNNAEPLTFPNIPVTLTVELVNEPPECDQASPSVMTLWPPSHKFTDVNILGVTDPDGDPVTITINSIFQDELVDGLGGGKFTPDGAGVGTSAVQVRAERFGRDNGRVYHITFSADDGRGGTCTGTVMVSVPHDQSGAPAVDEGPLYDSTSMTP